MKAAWCALLLVAGAGCVSPLANLRSTRELSVARSTFTLRYSDTGTQDADRVASSLARAAPRLTRWGGLMMPVTVNVVESHDDLERAVHRPRYAWLRAWARYDDVILQSPRTWLTGDRDDELDQLLIHELTHCVLFQRVATRDSWLKREVPLWFREGMATNTAGQEARFPSLTDLARWLEANPSLDIFTEGEALSQDHFEAVYGLSHHAMAFLLRRNGDAAVNAIIEALAKGAPFPDAFRTGAGLALESFKRDFLNYVRFRGFRGAGLPVNKRDWREQIEDLRPR